jgi:hypothetical protein
VPFGTAAPAFRFQDALGKRLPESARTLALELTLALGIVETLGGTPKSTALVLVGDSTPSIKIRIVTCCKFRVTLQGFTQALFELHANDCIGIIVVILKIPFFPGLPNKSLVFF